MQSSSFSLKTTTLNKRFKKVSPQRYQVPLSIQFKCQPFSIRHVSNNALLSSPCWTSRRFLDINTFQTISYLSLNAYTLDFTRQLSLPISKPPTSLSEGEYFRATVFVLSFSIFVSTRVCSFNLQTMRLL